MKKSEKQKYEYLAFISYQRKDEVIAKRLQHTLEFYNLPIAVIENHPEHPELKDGIRPIFVDMTELGDEPFLKPAIEKALKESRFLIVICSPRSAESKWVNKEVQYFQKLKRTKRIIPFIIEGTPNAQLGDEECCTPLLKKLLGERELLGLNINEMGFDAAAVKVVSRMFRIGFRTLWNRFEMEKEEEQRKEREKKDKLFRLQSRFIADRAKTVATYDSYLARRLAVEVLPENIDNPNRPYVPEAEAALRYSSYQSNTILRGHDNSACSVVYSPDGERILSFSTDMIKIWDVETGINIYTIEESFHGADFYQDSKHIITISGILKDTKVIIHDLDTGEIKPITGFQDFLGFKCSFSPNRALVATDMDTLWDITKGELQKKLAGDEYTTVGSERYFSPDSTLIASCSDHQVWINNVYGDDYMVLPEEHTDNVCAVSFSPADKNLVSASWDKTLKIWDIETISVLITLTGHTERVFTVAYSQDGKRIASGDEGGTIIIWNPETGEILKRFEGHLKSISSIQFSPDGKHIVSSSADKTIRLWDLEDHAELRQYNKTDTYSNLFEHIAVNPVENTLSYSLDNCLVLLNLETQSVFRAFCATEGNVNSFAFSSDGEKIITTSGKTLLLWNLKTGKLHRTFRGHHDEVFFVSFSIDGNRVVSTSVDKTLKIWDIKSGECIITKEVKAWMAIPTTTSPPRKGNTGISRQWRLQPTSR